MMVQGPMCHCIKSHARMYVCMHEYVYVHACMCVCVCVYMSMSVCVHMSMCNRFFHGVSMTEVNNRGVRAYSSSSLVGRTLAMKYAQQVYSRCAQHICFM